MAGKPLNENLWHMLIQQAKAKFRVYPSIAASGWVHSEYVKKGGRFAGEAGTSDK